VFVDCCDVVKVVLGGLLRGGLCELLSAMLTGYFVGELLGALLCSGKDGENVGLFLVVNIFKERLCLNIVNMVVCFGSTQMCGNVSC
jgi:hypothetical protein